MSEKVYTKVFADGLNVKRPHERQPDFVIANLGFNVDKFKAWLDENKDDRGWVNMQILESNKQDKPYYAQLDQWKPKDQGGGGTEASEDIPF